MEKTTNAQSAVSPEIAASEWTTFTRGGVALTINVKRGHVHVNNTPVRLTDIEWRILVALVEAETRYMTPIALHELLYNERMPSKSTRVKVMIHKTRIKLSAVGADGFLQTRHGMGYRLCGA